MNIYKHLEQVITQLAHVTLTLTRRPGRGRQKHPPGREDDDSGLQVLGLQQQRRQVGVLAEQQHLLRLEEPRRPQVTRWHI